jgi:hypothetical protein
MIKRSLAILCLAASLLRHLSCPYPYIKNLIVPLVRVVSVSVVFHCPPLQIQQVLASLVGAGLSLVTRMVRMAAMLTFSRQVCSTITSPDHDRQNLF